MKKYIYKRQVVIILAVLIAIIIDFYDLRNFYIKFLFYLLFSTAIPIIKTILLPFVNIAKNRLLYTFIYFSPMYYFSFELYNKKCFMNFNFGNFLLAILVSLIWFLINHQITKNSIVIGCSTHKERLSRIATNFISVLAEELFFRAVYYTSILNNLSINIVIYIIINSVLFVLMHYFNRWSHVAYNWRSYLLQFLLSVSIGYVFFISENLLFALLIHIFFNLSYNLKEWKIVESEVEFEW